MPKARISRTTRSRTASSRTTPLGTSARPASNWGLMREMIWLPGARQATIGGRMSLTVIKDLGLREPYIGKIALVSGEIAEDLTAYYYISEQQNTASSLGVKIDTDYSVRCSGGMIIQMLPDAEEGAVDALEEVIGKMKPVTTLIEEVMAAGSVRSEEGLVTDLLNHTFREMPEEYQPEVLEIRDLNWVCDCSEGRLEQVLMTIGAEDLREIIEEDGQAELVCQFCRKAYHFDKAHLQRILSSVEKA